MEASFYPPRHQFNNNNYEDNLNQQHEALKRMMNSYENLTNHHIDIEEEIIRILTNKDAPKPIKLKRRIKKELQS